MHHLAHNRTGPDDRHLNDEIVKLLRIIPRQGSHLGATLDLEHTDGIGTLQRAIDLVIFRQLCQIHFVAVVFWNQFQAVFENGHHTKAEQIYLDNAKISAIFFVPLHDGASRHGCAFERHNAIQLALADHHAARVLTEMTRQALNARTEFEVFGDTWVFQVKARILERLRHGVGWAAPFKMVHQSGMPQRRFREEPKSLPNVTCSRFAPIREDICCDRCAQFAIALIDVLNCTLAQIFRRQTKIDIRPLASTFTEKSLEEEAQAYRIDRGNLKRIADCRICCTSPPLYQDVILFTEAHNIPDDEKVS